MSNPAPNNESSALRERIIELENDVEAGKRSESASQEIQANLSESLAYAESIIDTVREPMLVLDGTLHVRTANRSFYQVFEVKPEETIGRYIYHLGNHQWDIPALRKLLEEVLPEQKAFRDFEVNHDFPSLGKRVMLLNARKLWREENHTEHILLAIEDITERRAAQEELSRSNDDLKSFAYIAAHDLRSPLNSGLSLLQLVIRRSGDALQKQDRAILDLAIGNFERLGTLMQDILSFSVMGNSAPNPTRLSLDEPLDMALNNLQHHINEEGAAITRSTLPTALADPSQMIMVFQNLIGNALKYRGSERPLVQIQAERDGRFWRISVTDNGQGIPKKYAEQIFQPFKRLHGSDVPGSGIGLATCKRVIERLGGQIWVESIPGKGSTFFFTLLA